MLCAIALVAACAPSSPGDGDGGFFTSDASPFTDAPTGSRPIDASAVSDADNSSVYPDARIFPDGGMCADWMCTDPVASGCDIGGPDICGDGTDNDCDGEVDEGCACSAGAVQPCFLGPPGKRHVGGCQDGMQTCFGSGEITFWGDCEGGIKPSPEVCDSLDNDCNGCADDHPDCCSVELMCPAPGDLPDGSPFTAYVIDGTMFWPGAYTSWSWTVVGGPCDQLLDSTTGIVSYTLSGDTTPTLTFTPTLSGDYTVTMTVVDGMGITHTCTFIVHIAGPGVRYELCWDTTGAADIDLHVHKPDSTSPWFSTTPGGSTINSDDCYYYNCKASAHCALPPPFPCIPGGDVANWGYADSALAQCQGGPEGTTWASYGACANPRLDIDNIFEAGRPENVNIDLPVDSKTYRAMVHYYGGSVPTSPMVNVYCGGTLKATYGASPDTVGGFTAGGGFEGGPMWRVVDVTPTVVGGVTTDCTTDALHPPGMPTGYWVTNDDTTY